MALINLSNTSMWDYQSYQQEHNDVMNQVNIQQQQMQQLTQMYEQAYYTVGWMPAPSKEREKTFREELQDDVNLWLKGI